MPGGEEGSTSGAIVFGTVSWSNEKASVEVSTNTEYRMQYQVNGTGADGWKEVTLSDAGTEETGESSGTRSGSITNLNHNDTIYVRLTDGTNYGAPTNTTIKDTINPAEAQINLSTTEAIAGQTITARVTHIDNESGVNAGTSKWVFNAQATNIGTDEGSYTGGTFTSNGETINIPTNTIGTYYLHVLTVDKAGNKQETISKAVTIRQIEGI